MKFISRIFASKSQKEDNAFLATVKARVKTMQAELDNLVSLSADAMSHHNRLDSEYQKYVRQSEEWKTRARECLGSGDESLARQALARKAECDKQAAGLEADVRASRQTSEQLAQQVTQVKQRIAEAERSAATLVARKNAAKAQQKIADSMAGLRTADDAFGAIENYEQSVVSQEARGSVFDLEDEPKNEGSDLDAELEALRKEMSN